MKFKLMSGLLMALFLITACSDSDDRFSGEGRLNVYLTDAPFPFESVEQANVTIFKIEARKAEEGDMDDTGDDASSEDTTSDGMDAGSDDSDSSPYIVLMEEEVSVNLLDLTNGITEELATTDVPAGSYDLVRVYVKGVNVVLTTGETFDLKVPSGSQTGIKIFIEPGIQVVGGLSADLLLDFDVSRSFVAKGGPSPEQITGFNFKPVIKASNMSVAGTLTGRIVETPETGEPVGLEGAQISILQEGEAVTSAFSDADGNYTIMGLLAGDYTVLVELEGYESVELGPVTIIEANRSTAVVELTPLTE